MIQQSYQRSVNILKTMNNLSGGNLIEIYRPGRVNPVDRVASLRYYGFITSLRAKINIKSIPESEIPNLDVTSSRVERITAVRDLEWRSARKEVEFYLKTSNEPLTHIATSSLLNRLPYYQINLLQLLSDSGMLEIANDAILYARITNAGYGLLNNEDSLTIYGAVKEEITILPDEEREITFASNYQWTVGESSQMILPANPNRLQATLVNESNSVIYLSYIPIQNAGIGGISLMPGGGSYEINQTNPYRGAIYAKALTGQGILSGLEAV